MSLELSKKNTVLVGQKVISLKKKKEGGLTKEKKRKEKKKKENPEMKVSLDLFYD
jgi:hypothetical protein